MIISFIEIFTNCISSVMVYFLRLKRMIPFMFHLSFQKRYNPLVHLELGWKFVVVELECIFQFFPAEVIDDGWIDHR